MCGFDLLQARMESDDMQKEIVNVGNLKGKHGGWKVYSTGGIIATLGASDFKHSKMIVVWLKDR